MSVSCIYFTFHYGNVSCKNCQSDKKKCHSQPFHHTAETVSGCFPADTWHTHTHMYARTHQALLSSSCSFLSPQLCVKAINIRALNYDSNTQPANINTCTTSIFSLPLSSKKSLRNFTSWDIIFNAEHNSLSVKHTHPHWFGSWCLWTLWPISSSDLSTDLRSV